MYAAYGNTSGVMVPVSRQCDFADAFASYVCSKQLTSNFCPLDCLHATDSWIERRTTGRMGAVAWRGMAGSWLATTALHLVALLSTGLGRCACG